MHVENCVFDSIHLRSTKIKWFARRLHCSSHVNHQFWILNQHFFLWILLFFSNWKISANNVVGSQRKTLPEIKAGVSITYCEVFGSSRRRSIAQVMNYQSGHSGRNYWNLLFQILITVSKTTTFQKKLHLWCWRCYCDACWELCFWFNSFEEHRICMPITGFITGQPWILNQVKYR